MVVGLGDGENFLASNLAAFLAETRRVQFPDDGEIASITPDGVTIIEQPDAGEVVWCDDAGVTCRRWNWRQSRRTQLRLDTTAALFILDALDPMTDAALAAADDDLVAHLTRLVPDVGVARRLIAAGPAPGAGG